MGVLNMAMRHAFRVGKIDRNPCDRLQPIKRKTKQLEIPDLGAVEEVLELARVKGHDLYPALLLCARLGLRRGEALGLTWDTVDLGARTVTVNKGPDQAQDGGPDRRAKDC